MDDENFTQYLESLGLTADDFVRDSDFTTEQQERFDMDLERQLQEATRESLQQQIENRRDKGGE